MRDEVKIYSLITFLMTSFVFALSTHASGVHYLARSPRCLLKADACLTDGKDPYAIFYNPASLGQNRGLQIAPLNPVIEGPNILGDLDRFSDIPNDPIELTEQFLDLPFYSRLGVAPGVKIGGFGLSLFANNTTNLVISNAIHPLLQLDYKYDRGFVMGYAFNFGNAGSIFNGPPKNGSRFSVGVSLKHIKREGAKDSFSLIGPELIDLISNEDVSFSDLKRQLGYSSGQGWGWDVGFEYGYTLQNLSFISGLSILDVADTRFKVQEGINKLPRQEMTVNWGNSLSQDFGIIDYRLDFDLAALNHGVDFGNLFKVGFEAGLPFLKGFFGWRSGYVSYGASIYLPPFRLNAGLYDAELTSQYRAARSKRFVISLDLFQIDFEL